MHNLLSYIGRNRSLLVGTVLLGVLALFLIVGHFVVAGILAVEEWWPNAPIFPLAVVWSVVTGLVSLALLPRVKGALVGYQWAMRMHGFGGPEKELA